MAACPDPEEDDRIPHAEEVHERLRAGAEYLEDLIAELGLRDRGVRNVPAGLGMARRG
ncbi:MAG: hypothetical protein HYU66_24130 [Armatimonadetes bacterium]|nr:hypothetical protein [Armatimonadota bacterium]